SFAIRSRWSRWLFCAAAAFSVGQLFLLTSSWPYIAPDVIWPVANLAWWTITRHWVAPNLGHYLGIGAIKSLIPPALLTASALWLTVKASFAAARRRAAPPGSAAGLAA